MRWLNNVVIPLMGIMALVTLLDEYGLHKVGESLPDSSVSRVLLLTRILILLFPARVLISFLFALNPLGHLRQALFGTIFSVGIIAFSIVRDRTKPYGKSSWQYSKYTYSSRRPRS